MPRHAEIYGHWIKYFEELVFLQKPGFGPIFVPPKHRALSDGQVWHSPGDVILTNEKLFPYSHYSHFPATVNYSPISQSLSWTTILNSMSV